MATHRFEIDAGVGPAREGVLGGRSMLLVRVRMFDGPGVVDTLTGEPAGTEDVHTDLRPSEARELAFSLCAAPSTPSGSPPRPAAGSGDEPHRV
jgi:hypothetical protein